MIARTRGLDHTARAECGVVLVEFLFAFAPLLLMFLATLQLALIGVAELIVRHTAVAGVRAAVVVLDDDPRFYEREARGSLRDADDGRRVSAIRDAVRARIAAIDSGGDTSVTFPTAPHATTSFEQRVDPGAPITLRIRHEFACVVPIAEALLCVRSERDPRIALRVIEAEATLPAQDAAYTYASERDSQRQVAP